MTIRTRSVALADAPSKIDGSDVYRFTAATERPVRVFDPERGEIVHEILPMSGVDLTRYRSNPIVLDAHRRGGTEFVAGRSVTVDLDGPHLVVGIRFTKATEAGRRNLDLVEDGSLRTLSIGYGFSASRDVGRDPTTGCPIVERTAWEVTEVSTAPVPADPDALLRAYQESRMADKDKAKKADDEKPAKKPADDDERMDDEDEDEDEKAKKGKKAKADEADGEDEKRSAPAPLSIEDELAAAIESRRNLIRSLCSDAETVAEGERLLLESEAPHQVDVLATIRPAMLAHLAKRSKPVGTPDTEDAGERAEQPKTPNTEPKPESQASSLIGLLRS